MTSSAAKAEWRARLLRARRERPRAERDRCRDAIAAHLQPLLAQTETVCAYLPLPSEPLPPELPWLLAAHGHRVLVPVAAPGAPLDWCELPVEYDAALVPGPLGVAEPAGPRLGPSAIRQAEVVVVPALATDPAGYRLGRGGGFYDRSLALLTDDFPASSVGGSRRPGNVVTLVAVVFDDEADLPIPRGPLDVPVNCIVTPSGGVRRLK